MLSVPTQTIRHYLQKLSDFLFLASDFWEASYLLTQMLQHLRQITCLKFADHFQTLKRNGEQLFAWSQIQFYLSAVVLWSYITQELLFFKTWWKSLSTDYTMIFHKHRQHSCSLISSLELPHLLLVKSRQVSTLTGMDGSSYHVLPTWNM